MERVVSLLARLEVADPRMAVPSFLMNHRVGQSRFPFTPGNMSLHLALEQGADVGVALRGGQEVPAGLEDVSVVRDEFEDAGPLGGLHALLKWMPGEWVLVVSCDQPFVRVNLLHGIMSQSECTADAVVARTPERLQPMPGLYRKSCLPVVDGALRRGEHGMRDVLNGLPRYELAGEDLDCLDLEHSSFVNVNTPKDLLRARRLASSL